MVSKALEHSSEHSRLHAGRLWLDQGGERTHLLYITSRVDTACYVATQLRFSTIRSGSIDLVKKCYIYNYLEDGQSAPEFGSISSTWVHWVIPSVIEWSEIFIIQSSNPIGKRSSLCLHHMIPSCIEYEPRFKEWNSRCRRGGLWELWTSGPLTLRQNIYITPYAEDFQPQPKPLGRTHNSIGSRTVTKD